MKYITIDERNGDIFTKEFQTAAEAIKHADNEWIHLTEKEQKNRTAFYVLESVNPDEEAEDHFDGDIIKEYK